MRADILLGPGELQRIDPIVEFVQLAFLEWLLGQHLNYNKMRSYQFDSHDCSDRDTLYANEEFELFFVSS